MRKRIASGLRACGSVLKADSELSMQAYCTDVPTSFQKLGHPQEQPYQTFAASEDIYIRWTSIRPLQMHRGVSGVYIRV
jgi:hypothetical protein